MSSNRKPFFVSNANKTIRIWPNAKIQALLFLNIQRRKNKLNRTASLQDQFARSIQSDRDINVYIVSKSALD